MKWLLLHHPTKACERIKALDRELERQGINATEVRRDTDLMRNAIKAELNKAYQEDRLPTILGVIEEFKSRINGGQTRFRSDEEVAFFAEINMFISPDWLVAPEVKRRLLEDNPTLRQLVAWSS
jgi:hypothetical protein